MTQKGSLQNYFTSVSPKVVLLALLATTTAASAIGQDGSKLSKAFKKKHQTEQTNDAITVRQVPEVHLWDNDPAYVEAKKKFDAEYERQKKRIEDEQARELSKAGDDLSTRMGYLDKDEQNRWIDLDARHAPRREYVRARNDLNALRTHATNDYNKRKADVDTYYNNQRRDNDRNYDNQMAGLNGQFAGRDPYRTALALKTAAEVDSVKTQGPVLATKTDLDLAKERMDKRRTEYLEQQYGQYLKTVPSGTEPMTPGEFLQTLEPKTVASYTAQDSLYYKNYLMGFPAGDDEAAQRLSFEKFTSTYTEAQRRGYGEYIAKLADGVEPMNALEYFSKLQNTQALGKQAPKQGAKTGGIAP